MQDLRRFGALLREWRGRVPPPRPDRRRTPGLRREELAALSGVSTDYVRRLEQGRARPSRQVLKAVAAALAVSPAEYAHLCILTGYALARPGEVNRHLGPATRQLLDRLDSVPVAVFDAGWTLITYNELAMALCGNPFPCPRRELNMVWRHFTNTTNCTAPPPGPQYEAALVADLREAATRYPADRELADLVTALHEASPRFSELWHSGATGKFESRSGVLNHPTAGPIRTDGTVLTAPEGDLRLLVFTVAPGSEDAEKLAALRTDSPRVEARQPTSTLRWNTSSG
ncbi:helix-turn-helix domain-containing protein [Amycolatopsis jejuensis]|uniref:helix-turn-helix domain-containing protein n=1 Tax=Amycolatopsis jejuensis TaxID=330084 RepID=UPI00068DCC18|nr:helix-turn-helix domain-containing protein [Amycolatopsis jejuensis]